jgi:hypothetical protein
MSWHALIPALAATLNSFDPSDSQGGRDSRAGIVWHLGITSRVVMQTGDVAVTKLLIFPSHPPAVFPHLF